MALFCSVNIKMRCCFSLDKMKSKNALCIAVFGHATENILVFCLALSIYIYMGFSSHIYIESAVLEEPVMHHFNRAKNIFWCNSIILAVGIIILPYTMVCFKIGQITGNAIATSCIPPEMMIYRHKLQSGPKVIEPPLCLAPFIRLQHLWDGNCLSQTLVFKMEVPITHNS